MRNIFQGIQRSGTEKDIRVDSNGRVGVYPYQIRDLCVTGFATLTRGAETAILAADAGKTIDVLTITGANTSDIAQKVLIRTGTAGSTMDSLVVPAASVVSKSYHVPLLGSEKDQKWTAQNTGTDVSDSAVDITVTGVKND